jgi:recombination protein RecT
MTEASISTTKAITPMDSLRKEATAMESEFLRALPPHIQKDKFLRVLMTAVQTSMASNFTNLLECDRRSLWQAAIRAAQDGLLPDGREGAILKYGDAAQWIPMVAGIRKKARNSGEISTWDVHCVYENDQFVLKLGDAPSIEHTYDLAKIRGRLIGAYSVALLKDGSKSYEVMSIDEIHAIRDRSQAWQAFRKGKIKSTPWDTDEAEMARKTVAKRHAKQLPSSADLDDLMRRDDELHEFKREDKSGSSVTELKRPKGKAALDQFATRIEHKPEAEIGTAVEMPAKDAVTVNQQTGEVQEAFEQHAYDLGHEARISQRARRVPDDVVQMGDAFKESWLRGWDSADDEMKAEA